MNNTSYKNYKEFYHDCPSKKCMGNFSGTCRQPFLRCDNNVDIAFKALEEAKKLEKFKEYFMELYGKGLEVANWHMNGELEPLDGFIDSAIECMEEDGNVNPKNNSNSNQN